MDLVEVPNHLAQRHPWEQIRFQFFFRLLAASGLLENGRTVLDVGAGDAWFAEQLASRSAIHRIVCWDPGYSIEFLASRRLADPVRIELTAERPTGRSDVLVLLDVLEHVEDADRFLANLVRDNLEAGGHALISVPAWPWLFSSHEVRLRHYRRYTPASARALIGNVGLEIIRSAGLFHSLLPVRAMQVARERLAGPPPASAGLQWNAPLPLTLMVRGTLAFDAWFSMLEARLGLSIPGLSWWALCRKASS